MSEPNLGEAAQLWVELWNTAPEPWREEAIVALGGGDGVGEEEVINAMRDLSEAVARGRTAKVER